MKYIGFGKPSVLDNQYLRDTLERLDVKVFETPKENPWQTVDDVLNDLSSEIPALSIGGDGMTNGIINSVRRGVRRVVGVFATGSGCANYWNFGIKKTWWPSVWPSERRRIDDSAATIEGATIDNGRIQGRDLLKVRLDGEELYATWVSFGYSADVVHHRTGNDYILPALEAFYSNCRTFTFGRRKLLAIHNHTTSMDSTPFFTVVTAHEVSYFGHGITIARTGETGRLGVTEYVQRPAGVVASLLLAGLGCMRGKSLGSYRSLAVTYGGRVEFDGELLKSNSEEKVVELFSIPNAVDMIVG